MPMKHGALLPPSHTLPPSNTYLLGRRYQCLPKIEELLEHNINEDGECQFSYLKEKIVLEMAKEIITDGVPDPPMCFTSC